MDTFETLGDALKTAQGELQVTIDIFPARDMAPSGSPPPSGPWFVRQPYCKGTIRYPDNTTGTLVVVKTGIPKEAPWSVLAYAQSHAKFPCDPTLDQLYDADRFDAYRELGEFSMDAAFGAFGTHP